jgi:ABC-type dipeptide/oligopeptide/nickel transport system ATPase subunit
MDLATIIADFDRLESLAQRGKGLLDHRREHAAALAEDVAQQEAELTLLTHTGTALDELLKKVSLESLDAVEKLITYGLQTVFEEPGFAFRMEVSKKQGLQWMEPRLVLDGVDAPVLEAFGGGPAQIVAFLLRLLVLRRLKLAPLLVLDEPFAMVSEQYRTNVGKLLAELCARLDLTILMVSHETEYVEHATKAYTIAATSNGATFKDITVTQQP